MSQNTPISSMNLERVRQQVNKKTPEGVIIQISRQMDRADEAQKRILEEGLVVRDMKGSVIAHPAIQIEKDACKIITDLLHRHR